MFKYLNKCLKSVVSIQTIMSVRLCGGLYYNIGSSKLIALTARIYCIWCVTVLSGNYYKLLAIYNTSGTILTVLNFIQYITAVVINFICNGEYFFNFLHQIRNIDVALGVKPDDEIACSRIIFMFCIFQKLFTVILICVDLPEACAYNSLVPGIALLETVIILSNITRIMMFESIFIRMKMIRKRLQRELSVTKRFENSETVIRENVRKCMIVYKDLLKTTRITDGPMKPLIFLSIAVVVPMFIIVVYDFIGGADPSYRIINTCETILESTIPFIPAILAEKGQIELEKINLCIVKQLLVLKGEPARDAIEDSVKYLQQRPFKYTVWRLFTLDVTIILSVMGLITTYTVAMIQFAHFYD